MKEKNKNFIDSFIYYYQKPFIFLINFVFKKIGKIKEKTRRCIVKAFFYIIPIFFITLYSGAFTPYSWNRLSNTLIGTLILVLFIVFSINKKAEHVRWRQDLIIPIVLSGIGIIAVGFFHTVGAGFQIFGVQLLIVLPALFLVWNNREDYEFLFKGLSKGTGIVVFVYFLLCCILATRGDFKLIGVRWAGTMVNVNLLSQIGTNASLMCIYMIVAENKDKLFYYSVLGIGFGFSLLGGSRGAALTCIICAIAAIIYVAIRNKGNNSLKASIKAKRFVAHALAFSVFLTFTFVGLPFIQRAVSLSADRGNIAVEDQSAIERMSLDGHNDANSFSSGRVEIWHNFIEELNLIGHDYDGTDWEELTPTKNGHNIFLDVAYRCGVPIATMFVFLQIVTGLIALVIIFNRKNTNTNYLFFILFFLEYFYESTVDVAIMPTHRYTVFLFYISLTCIIKKRNAASRIKDLGYSEGL